MKQKHFYSHIIEIDSLYIALDDIELDPEEKTELHGILETTIHHVVIDTVLSELSEEHKKTALSHIAEQKHDDLWTLLKDQIHNVEEKIKSAVHAMKNQMHKDIEEAAKQEKNS